MPTPFVVVVRTVPRSTLTMSTLAPTITAAPLSVTRPEIVDVAVWANTEAAQTESNNSEETASLPQRTRFMGPPCQRVPSGANHVIQNQRVRIAPTLQDS